MTEGFDDYFQDVGSWPWRTAEAFRQRHVTAGLDRLAEIIGKKAFI